MDNYLIRIIPLLVFFIIFYKSFKKNNKIAMCIISVYLVSSFSSLFIIQEDLRLHDFKTDSVFYIMIYTIIHGFFLSLTLYLKPFTSVDQLPKGRVYNWLIVVFSIAAIFSIIYLTPYAIISLSTSAYDVRTAGEEVLPSSYLTTIAVGFPSFYYVYVFMFYVALIKKKKLNAIVASLGVLSFVVNVLTISGRDGIFLAFYSLVLGFFCFEPLLTYKLKKRVKKYFLISIILGILPIIKITIDRFSQDGTFTFMAFKKGIVNYLGMQPFIFSDWLKDNLIFNGGANAFSFFVNKKPVEYYEYYTWNFGTYLASFYGVGGYLSLFGLSALFYFIFRYVIKKAYGFSTISIFFFYGFFMHYMISGVFYFRLGTRGGNLFMFISLLLIVFLKKLGVKYKRTSINIDK